MKYYVHGYLSEPKSRKGIILKEKLDVLPLKYRDCKPEELVISECISRILDQIKDDNESILIGSSLGGFLAAKTALKKPDIKYLILLNPAIIPKYVDIAKIEDMPQKILQDMQDENLFKEKIQSKIFILAGTMDDTVPNDWIIEFAKAQEATIKFLHDDHSLTKNIEKLPNMIKNILGEKH
jgi:predicted esterase YcpF (UPF0227 family)